MSVYFVDDGMPVACILEVADSDRWKNDSAPFVVQHPKCTIADMNMVAAPSHKQRVANWLHLLASAELQRLLSSKNLEMAGLSQVIMLGV